MKHIATVPAAIIKAAMHFQAKQDIRFYLNGIRITHDHIVATNGHALFVAPYESKRHPDEPIIVTIKGKIPPKALELELLHDEDSKVGVIRCTDKTPLRMTITPHGGEPQDVTPIAMPVTDRFGHQEKLFFEMFEGRYPDWNRVVPTGDLVPTARFGMDFGYADWVAKACKDLGSPLAQCAVNLRGDNTAIEIELNSPIYPGAKVIIMPCRL